MHKFMCPPFSPLRLMDRTGMESGQGRAVSSWGSGVRAVTGRGSGAGPGAGAS